MKKFLEKKLEEIIFEAWGVDPYKLIEKGLDMIPISGKIFRQKRIGNYGICDLLFIERFKHPAIHGGMLSITIFELKQNIIDEKTLMQSIRYAKGIKRYLSTYREFTKYFINIVLIGEDVKKDGSLIFVPDLIPSVEFCEESINSINYFEYFYDFDGIKFNNILGYSLTNEGFVI